MRCMTWRAIPARPSSPEASGADATASSSSSSDVSPQASAASANATESAPSFESREPIAFARWGTARQKMLKTSQKEQFFNLTQETRVGKCVEGHFVEFLTDPIVRGPLPLLAVPRDRAGRPDAR